MFASSQTDKSRAQQVSDLSTQALEKGGVKGRRAKQVLGGTVRRYGPGQRPDEGAGRKPAKKDPTGEVVELLPSMKRCPRRLKKEIQDGKIDMHLEARRPGDESAPGGILPSGEDSVGPWEFWQRSKKSPPR